MRLKLEGANPTGSFKDRGMTCAVSAAVRDGAKAVICASTGNTAASAAAYAARAGITCAVIVPEGKIAQGKMAQTLMHGARVISLAGNFDQALELVRELTDTHPIVLVNSVNEFRIEGQKTAAFEIDEELEGELERSASRSATPATSPPTGAASARSGAAPRLFGFQAEGAAPLVLGHRVEHPETIASAIRIGNPVRWEDAMAATTESRGAIRAVSDKEILDAYRLLAAREGMFCEPASAASVAGLLKYGADGADADRVRAHRPRAEGPRDRDRQQRRQRDPVRGRARRRSRKRCWVIRRRRRARAGLLGEPGPRLRLHGGGARAARWSSRWPRPASSPSRPTCRSRRGRENLCVRAFERLHPADDFTFRIRSEIPLSGGLGSSAAAIVAGLMAADHLFELDADLLAEASAIEGHPDNVAAATPRRASSSAPTARSRASSRRPGSRRSRSCPSSAVRTRAARAALPAEVPMRDAVFNVAHAALLTLGLARGDWDLLARGLHDRLHQQQRAHLFPRSFELAARARRAGRARRDDLRRRADRAGLVLLRADGRRRARRSRAEIEGWATLVRAPFEPQGAYVGEL